MRLPIAFLLVLLAAPGGALAGSAEAWRGLPRSLSADSCLLRLRAWEVAPARGVTIADAALALGELHYARGEYRQARDAFGRASARGPEGERGEARYWMGLCSLALGEGATARKAFADAAREAPARRALAELGTAQAWDVERRPDRSLEVLQALLAGDPGEAGPAALEREAALAEQLHRPDEAREARRRLAREYPRSLEATRLGAAVTLPVGSGPVGVQIGVFADRERARSLSAQAKKAGFAGVQVIERRGEGARPTLWVVRLGSYATREEAESAGERAQATLGVGWQVMAP